ncbi:hypothetical protein [Acinetobacter nosocomialis]|uniref:hypothetical protein n=1 Tax=Acinetobacter nosocomialis TaxID=106654 RepID=UPI001ADB29D1|nr:hypothetical protein [Acinetobacter nosocomialis]MBO8215150.1 hypothetical protein [Acinetobacter nosocomialis]
MKKLIKLMPDYQCYPLWEYDEFGLVANLNPKDLPISKVFSIIKFFKVERKLSRKNYIAFLVLKNMNVVMS